MKLDIRVVPETATGWLMLSGLLALGPCADRGRRANQALWGAVLGTLLALPSAQAQLLAEVWDGTGSHLIADSTPGGAHVEQSLDETAGLSGSYDAAAFASPTRGAAGGWIFANHTKIGHITGPLVVHMLATTGDALTFYGPGPDVLDFSLTVSGAFNPIDLGGHIVHSILSVGGARNDLTIVWGGGPAEPSAAYFASGEISNVSMELIAIHGTLHLHVPVTPGQRLRVSNYIDMEITPTQGFFSEADFRHTAQLAIDMPAGWSFTSGSGIFMSETSPVPEPQTWALTLTGIAGLAIWRRHRAVRPPR